MGPENMGLENLGFGKFGQQKRERTDRIVRLFNTEKLEVIPNWVKASLAFQPFECQVRKECAEPESAYNYVSNCTKSTIPFLLLADTML